jgi:lipopolysaccharide transport system ATP-binding protein
MAAVKSLCTRGIIIKNGLIDYIGDINSTVERYLTDSDSSKNTHIIDNIKWVKSTLKITHVSINGTDSSFSTIRSGQRTLEVKIKGYTSEEMIYDEMIIIKSKEGVPFATYSPGHYFGDIRHQPPGEFEIVRDIELPPILSEGQLLVDLYLHHPMVEYLVKAPNCCILESQGYQSGYGHALNTGYGFIGLKDNSRKTT